MVIAIKATLSLTFDGLNLKRMIVPKTRALAAT